MITGFSKRDNPLVHPSDAGVSTRIALNTDRVDKWSRIYRILWL
jgi:hypothetical protein